LITHVVQLRQRFRGTLVDRYPIRTRTGAVAGVVALSLLGGAPVAEAVDAEEVGVLNWSSSIGSAGRYFESRRWDDESYSQLWFEGCTIQGGPESTKVAMWEDNAFSPDDKYDTKTFTNCFNGANSRSMGEWHGLEKDNYYFRLEDVGSNGSGLLWVRKVTVDTSAADQ
jgi:hypothetical protein